MVDFLPDTPHLKSKKNAIFANSLKLINKNTNEENSDG
jgi:hypothetical protein